MKKIIVSEKIYTEAPKYEGYESYIYKVDGMLYKIFKTTDKKVLLNKQAKEEILHCLNIKHIKPIDFIEINGVIQGYTEEEKIGYQTLDMFQNSRKEKLKILKNVLNELIILHNNGIIYGDLNLNNILVNNGDVCFCDLDNSCIENYDFDVLSFNEQQYLNQAKSSIYLDNYMLNLVTISYLSRILEPYTLIYLRNHDLPIGINTKENHDIVKKMIGLNPNTVNQIEPFIMHEKKYHLF
jgi:serine/threonine protein kinase